MNSSKSGNISGQTVNTIQPTGDSNTALDNVREIKVRAFRFDYEPNIITIKKGEKVRFIINNSDTLHGMKFPDLSVSGDDAVELSVDKSGTYKWYCNNFCGEGHKAMSGTLVVTD